MCVAAPGRQRPGSVGAAWQAGARLLPPQRAARARGQDAAAVSQPRACRRCWLPGGGGCVPFSHCHVVLWCHRTATRHCTWPASLAGTTVCGPWCKHAGAHRDIRWSPWRCSTSRDSQAWTPSSPCRTCVAVCVPGVIAQWLTPCACVAGCGRAQHHSESPLRLAITSDSVQIVALLLKIKVVRDCASKQRCVRHGVRSLRWWLFRRLWSSPIATCMLASCRS